MKGVIMAEFDQADVILSRMSPGTIEAYLNDLQLPEDVRLFNHIIQRYLTPLVGPAEVACILHRLDP